MRIRIEKETLVVSAQVESGHNIGPSTGQLREQLDAYATSSDCFSEMAGEDGTIYETFYGINKDGRFGSFINHLIMSAVAFLPYNYHFACFYREVMVALIL